jgi:hypothetical protein
VSGALRVGLVGCVKLKGPVAAPARDLYVSALFRGRRRAVEATCDRWFVLSAKHHLVDPEQVLEPYDLALGDLTRAARREWSERVLADLAAHLGPLGKVTFEVHAGADYREFGLVDGLGAAGAAVAVPAAGLMLGHQLRFYAA